MIPAAGLEYTMEHPAETPGGSSPPDCCIWIGSSPSPLNTKKENPRSGFSFFWCSKAIQIRTGILLYGFLHIVQCDGSGTVFVVKGDDHFIIVQIDGIYKGINQHFAVRLLTHIQLPEFV